ncbi:hypothetical protein D3C72_1891110 [compost metagenome]
MSVRGALNGPEVAGQRPALPPSEPQTKSPDQGRGFLLYLVPETGIEPTTYAFIHLPARTRPQGTANFWGRHQETTSKRHPECPQLLH